LMDRVPGPGRGAAGYSFHHVVGAAGQRRRHPFSKEAGRGFAAREGGAKRGLTGLGDVLEFVPPGI